MADSTLAAMTAASTLSGSELFYCLQSAADRKATASQIFAVGGMVTGQFGVTAAGVTTTAMDGSSWMTFAAPNTKANMLTTYDHLGNITRTWDQASGRMDLYGVTSTGGILVVALNKSTTPANGDNLGHLAHRAKDTNLNYNTWAYTIAFITDVTPANTCSSISLAAMRNVNSTAGNGQPNFGLTIDGSGTNGSVTFPTGADIVLSGNMTNSKAAGPTFTFTNTTNSRNLIIGVGDNFSGTVNATGGGSLLLQNGGTTGIQMSSLIVSVGQTIPARIGLDYRLTKTSNYSPLQADSGTDFDNNTAAGEVDFTLPSAPTSGTNFGFYVFTAQIVKVIAPAITTINVGGTVSAAAGNIASSQIGAYVRLVYLGSNKYIAKAVTGSGGSTGAGGWTVT